MLWDFPSHPVVKTLLPNAGGLGSIPGWETKIPHAMGCGQKVEKKKKKNQQNTQLCFPLPAPAIS